MKVILDTDIGPDCDDAAAIALLNILSNMGYCKILGIGHCTSNQYGAGTIDAICRYYGNCYVPIGTTDRKGFLCSDDCMKYNKWITTNFTNRFRSQQPENVVSLYRKLLASENDNSVDFISIGPLNDLSDLLSSSADSYFPDNGTELVRKKVRKLTIMGGIYPSSYNKQKYISELLGQPYCQISEYNIECDIEAAQHVATEWPTEKVYLGFEAGLVKIGNCFQTDINKGNPVKTAYTLYSKDGQRYSWDPLTVEYAILSDNPDFHLSPAGMVRFDKKGRTIWKEDANGYERYVQLAKKEDKIAADLEQLFI